MIYQYLKKILAISILTICYASWGYANSTNKVDIKVVNGKIILYGHELKTKHEVKISKPSGETDTNIYTDLSPNNKRLIVTLGYYVEGPDTDWEFWFYDISKKREPIKIIPTNLPVRGFGVEWLSNDIFQIRWGGYGWSQIRFYDARNLNKNFLCDDCRFYDVSKDVYVAQRFFFPKSESKVEIGPGFNKDHYSKELFDLGLPSDLYTDSVVSAIKDVKIENTSLVVFCDKGKGTTEKLIFEPVILKEKKSFHR